MRQVIPRGKWNEEQLDFPFLAKADPATGTVAESKSTASLQFARPTGRSRGLASALANAHSTLLDAPIEEVSAQLLPLLEFCEAALTRTLDAVPLRVEGLSFSPGKIPQFARHWPSPMATDREASRIGGRAGGEKNP